MSWLLGKDKGSADAAYYWGPSPVPTEFDDITNNLTELDCCAEDAIGYKRARDLIKVVVATETAMYTTWGTYASNKQDIAAKWFAAPYALRIALINWSEEQDAKEWEVLLEKTKGVKISDLDGRSLIVEKMRRKASHELRKETMTKSNLDDFWQSTEKIFREYIDSNSPKFKQWLTNEVGSDYENAGFEEKSYYSQQLEDDLIAIYNGQF